MQKKKTKSQIARENGRKSKGPITPQGKQTSAQNALRHGFTSHKAVLLANESEEELRAFSQIHFDHYLPINEMEALALEEVIAAAWRIRRLWHTETTLFDIEIARQANYPCPIEPVDSYLRTTLAFQSLTATPATSAAAQAVNQTHPNTFSEYNQDNNQNQQQGGQLLLLQRYARSLTIQHTRALHNLQTLQANRPGNDNHPPATVVQPNEPTQPQSSTQPTPMPSHTEPLHPRNRIFHPTPLLTPDTVKCQAM